jgi:S-adenosylmethionine decarboxylase
MKTIGRHLIAEFYRCEPTFLDDVAGIRQLMLDTAGIIGATVMGHSFHPFTPQGVSGTVVISESHLSVHTWPEYGYVAVDIYTCGGLDPRPGFEYLRERLGAESSRVQEILRGLPEEVAAHRQLLSGDIRITSRTVPVSQIAPDA